MVPIVGFLDEIFEHFFGDVEICDHAIFHGFDRNDVSGSASQHLLGLMADGLDTIGDLVNRNYRGLVDYNPTPSSVNESICRTQINRQII
jgi:hypothetical protein